MTRRPLVRGLEAVGVVVAAILLGAAIDQYGQALRDSRYLAGWILAGGLVFLMALELRGQILTVPAGPMSLWIRVHSFLGWLVIATFVFHTEWRLPDSVFGWLLWASFLVLAGSGALGFLLARWIPPRLTDGGEPVPFEEIPVIRAGLARDARACAMGAVRDSCSSMIAASYVKTLQAYFARPRNLICHLWGSSSRIDRLTAELDAVAGYVDEVGRDRVAELRRLVVLKDDLDRQLALQGLLRGWPFVHLPIGYGILLCSIMHVLMVYGYSSGAP